MTSVTSTNSKGSFFSALATILVSAAVLSASVVGILIWKIEGARDSALRQNAQDLQNLAHSLGQHVLQSTRAVDFTLRGIADRLLDSPPPSPDRLNHFLRVRQTELPQVSGFGVLDEQGNWKYSSLPQLPDYRNADKSYFIHHQSNPSSTLSISQPLFSSGRWIVVASRRLVHEDGRFAGVAFAEIDLNYFRNYYTTFNLGAKGGIGLFRTDGRLLVHTLANESGADFSSTNLFQALLPDKSFGFFQVVSPFDSMKKSIAYEQSENYPLVVTIARAEDEVLAAWRRDVQSDATVALGFLGIIALVATALAAQFKFRLRIERSLRYREARYRLLAENAGDVVMQLTLEGAVTYISPAVELVLGWTEAALVGQPCAQFVHPDDMTKFTATLAELAEGASKRTFTYRMRKPDFTHLWVEIHLRRTGATEMVGSVRDVSERIQKDQKLLALNRQLASLASTDGLTGLANRRAFDQFLLQIDQSAFSLMMIDIDYFKSFNDYFGHLNGDECLRSVSKVIGNLVDGTKGFAARYGGEEFAILLPGIEPRRAAIIADALRLNVRALALSHPMADRKYLTVSVGIGYKRDEAMRGFDVLREADLALYKAKRLGRNRTVVFEVAELGDLPPLASGYDAISACESSS